MTDTTDMQVQKAQVTKLSAVDKWLNENLSKLKAKDKLSKQEKLLIELAERKKPEEFAMLQTLVRAQKAADRADAARIKAMTAIRSKEKRRAEEERKARNHRLIKQGLLFDYLGLDSRSREELAGILMAAARVNDNERIEIWRKAGAEFLKSKEPAKVEKNA